MELTEFSLFEIENLNNIEVDILLTLSDDINNRCFYHDPTNEKNKLLERTSLILQKKYTESEIKEGLCLLCLKGLIELRNNIISSPPEYLSTTQNIFKTYKESELLEYVKLIETILYHNRIFIRDNWIDEFADKRVDETMLEIELDIASGIFSQTQQKEILPLIRENRAQDTEEKVKIVSYGRRLNFLYSWISGDVEENADDLIRKTALRYLDKDKVINAKYISLSAHRNHGINGQQIADYFLRLQLDKKINDFKLLENKIPSMIDSLEEKNKALDKKVDNSLMRNIEIVSIFVAIITIIIGNVSFVPQIKSATLLEIISPILLINGSLLAGVSALVLLISKVVVREQSKGGVAGWITFGFSIVLIAAGIALALVKQFIVL